LKEKEDSLLEEQKRMESLRKMTKTTTEKLQKYILGYLPPTDQIFSNALEQIKEMIKESIKREPKKAYISYAWNKITSENTKLQRWLDLFSSHLKKGGFSRVFLDIRAMGAGNTLNIMSKNIEESDVCFIIGTRRFAERISEKSNNLIYELQLITAEKKPNEKEKVIIPLLLEGTITEIFEKGNWGWIKYLIYDFSKDYKFETKEKQYFNNIIGYQNPGILPSIFEIDTTSVLYRNFVDSFAKNYEKVKKVAE